MFYSVHTPAQFDQLIRDKGGSYLRRSLLKGWKKWRKGELLAICHLCDHRDENGALALKEWDCGCSYGCDACSINYKCTLCNVGFDHPNFAARTLSCWLELPRDPVEP